MMKKYWGKKDWSESLYLSYIFDEEDQRFDEDGMYFLDFDKAEQNFIHGMKFDWKHSMGFEDLNKFEDTNDFITYSETFNIYQDGKI
jgi:hypothetical protein